MLPNFASFEISLKLPKPKKLLHAMINFIFSIHSLSDGLREGRRRRRAPRGARRRVRAARGATQDRLHGGGEGRVRDLGTTGSGVGSGAA